MIKRLTKDLPFFSFLENDATIVILAIPKSRVSVEISGTVGVGVTFGVWVSLSIT
jgi:hypothetical protein